jgi:hypothetical protein
MFACCCTPYEKRDVRRVAFWFAAIVVVADVGLVLLGISMESDSRGPGGLGTFNFSTMALFYLVIQYVISPIVWCVAIGLAIYNLVCAGRHSKK